MDELPACSVFRSMEKEGSGKSCNNQSSESIGNDQLGHEVMTVFLFVCLFIGLCFTHELRRPPSCLASPN